MSTAVIIGVDGLQWQRNTVRSSTFVAHVLQALARWMFCGTVISANTDYEKCVYLCYGSLPLNSVRPWSSLTNKAFQQTKLPLTGPLMFLHHSVHNFTDCCE